MANPNPMVTGASNILSFLKAQGWPLDVAEESLATYLRTTHFLAQSAAVRLISQDPKQRWLALSQLNGAGLLERAQQRLLSRATTSALEDQIDAAKQRLAGEQERLERWLSILESRDALALQATAEGALTQGEVVISLARLLPGLSVSQESVEASLGVARKVLEDSAVEASQISGRLKSLANAPARFAEGVAQLAIARNQLNEAEIVRSTAAVEWERLHNELAHAVFNEQEASKALHAKQEREARIRQLRSGFEEISVIGARRTEHELRLAAATETSSVLERSFEQCHELLSRLEQLHRDLVRSLEHTTVLQSLSQTSKEIEQRRAANDLALKSADGIRNELARARESAALSQQQGLELATAERLARSDAEVARTGAEISARALAAVAALISESDELCPVCHSQFGPGALKRRADEVARLSNAEVAAAELQLQRSVEASRVAKAASQAAIEKVNRLTAGLVRTESEALEFQKQEAELSQMVSAQGLATSDIAGSLNEAIKTELARTRALRKAIESSPALEFTRLKATELAAQLSGLRSEVEAKTVERNELQAQHNLLMAMVAEHTAADIAMAREGPAVLSVWEAELSESARIVEVSARLRAELEKSYTQAKTARERALEDVASRRTKVETQTAQIEQLRVSWRAVLISGEPSEEKLAEALRLAAEKGVEAATKLERLDDIVRGYSCWKKQQALAERQSQVARFMADVRVTTEAGVSVELRRLIVESRVEVSRCESTRAAVGRFKTMIKEVTNSYFEEVVAPLNLVERSFANALTVRTPFSVEWATRLSRGATHLDLQGRFSGGEETVPAGRVLSEGQLAATAFTQLVSLSTGYQWSDWRALLLDDPVQHNDVLHVSAFVDLVRNLVRDQRYQVVLSTHDPSLAEFAARKFRAAKEIDFSIYWFTGITETGVRYRRSKE